MLIRICDLISIQGALIKLRQRSTLLVLLLKLNCSLPRLVCCKLHPLDPNPETIEGLLTVSGFRSKRNKDRISEIRNSADPSLLNPTSETEHRRRNNETSRDLFYKYRIGNYFCYYLHDWEVIKYLSLTTKANLPTKSFMTNVKILPCGLG